MQEPAMKLERRVPNTGRQISNRELLGMRYDTQKEAIFILEEIMHRKNWTVDTRDRLQRKIESIISKAKE
jgi:hypothetical protein